MIHLAREWLSRVRAFGEEVHGILSWCEASPSRVLSLDKTRRQLQLLSPHQSELFEEALSCIEHGLHRAAHVMAWAGFIDFFQRKLVSTGMDRVIRLRPDWARYRSIEELREHVSDFELIRTGAEMGLVSRNEMKTLHGLLSIRNECAHPSSYSPALNESLGYVAQLLKRLDQLTQRTL